MMRKRHPDPGRNPHGFTLIEILLVVTIIGILMAVIIPRAERARTDAKYTIVRQNATELAKWANEWATRNLESQDESDSCVKYNYVDTLRGYTGDDGSVNTDGNFSPNWTILIQTVTNKTSNGGLPSSSVEAIMPPEKQPRNPFNGVSYFEPPNGGGTFFASGDLSLAGANMTSSAGAVTNTRNPGDVIEYYFIYHGTDSDAVGTFHAGMGAGTAVEVLRQGVFVARLRVP